MFAILKREVKENRPFGVTLLRTLIMTHGTDHMGRTINCSDCTTPQSTSTVPNIQLVSLLRNPAK